MTDGRDVGPPNYCAKTWNHVFSENRGFQEDSSWVEHKRRLHAVGDEFSIFLEDSESFAPFSRVSEVQEYSQEADLEDLKSGRGLAERVRNIWLDDRSSSALNVSRSTRKYGNPLSAAELYSSLKIPV